MVSTYCHLVITFRIAEAFSIPPQQIQWREKVTSKPSIINDKSPAFVGLTTRHFSTQMSKSDTAENFLRRIPEEEEDIPIPFVDDINMSFIDCYADAIAQVGGFQYTIGSPCDHSVALCYFDENNELIPVELEEDLMDDVFPVAASIVEEEFGEELSLERTPQTLTLVGELEEGGEDEEYSDGSDLDEDEEDVEILLTFDHMGNEYNLVRLIDPVLLVGKNTEGDDPKCTLLSPEEADEVMPILEEMFLGYQEI